MKTPEDVINRFINEENVKFNQDRDDWMIEAMEEYAKLYHESEVKKLRLSDVMLRFKLRLNVETWGSYKKGDEDYFYIKLLDEQNGLARFPIYKEWDIVSCEIVNEV
jgi:hypothetical protein